MHRSLFRIISVLVVVGLFLTACAPSPADVADSTYAGSQPAAEGQESLANTASPDAQPPADAAGETPAESSAAQPQPSNTPDNRLPPERWQEWPVVPAVSVTAVNIYQQGMALGNNSRTFSKVGDCQSISQVMMGIYDVPGRYTLREEDAHLQETIDLFKGSFNRDGNAVKGGFNAASVLSPLWADPAQCLPGESPLECELRAHNPSIIIISLEVWWEGRTVERYEAYMRQIIETAISNGVVPVLSTKADNVEGDHSINYTTAKLAYEYDIPLWNFWLAVQPLDFRGLDPARDDFHITEEAWNVRSYTALQTLDTLYRAVQSGVAQRDDQQDQQTENQQTEPQQMIVVGDGSSAAQAIPTASGRIVFWLAIRTAGEYHYQGVFQFDFSTQSLNRILDLGYNLQAVSPDGSRLLVNNGSDLYMVNTDGSNLVLLANGFYALGQQGAIWMPDGAHIALIAVQDGEKQVRIMPLDGSPWTILSNRGRNPIELYPSPNPAHVVWADGSCVSYNDCSRTAVISSPISGGMDSELINVSDPVFSPDGSRFAYIDKAGEGKINLSVATLDRILDSNIPILGSREIEYVLMDLTWSPQSDRVHVLILERSDYSGEWMNIRNFIINMDNLGNQEFIPVNGQNSRTLWSPQDGTILLTSTGYSGERYNLNVRLLDIASKNVIDYSGVLALSASDYMLTTGLFWLP